MTSSAVQVLDAIERPVLLVRPYERRKPNLLELAADARRDLVATRLDEGRPLEDEAIRYFCGMNLSALVLYYAGDYARAAAICRREIETCVRLVGDGRPVHWAFYALEASLNTARLNALLGDTRVAVSQCRELLDFAFQGGRLTLGDRTFTRAHLQEGPSDNDENRKGLLRRLNALGSMAVWEANKAFLLSADYQGLLRFLDEGVVASLTSNRIFMSALLEARIKALIGLGSFDDAALALSRLHDLLGQDPAARRRVTILWAQLSLATERGGASLDWAARCVVDLDGQGRPDVEVWYLRFRAALICLMAGDADRAGDLCRQALATGRGLGDQVAVVKTCCLLLQILSGRSGREIDLEAVCYQLDEEAARCDYVTEAAFAYAELGTAYDRLGSGFSARARSCLASACARASLLSASPVKAHVASRCRELSFDARASEGGHHRCHERVEELFRLAMEKDAFATASEPPAAAVMQS